MKPSLCLLLLAGLGSVNVASAAEKIMAKSDRKHLQGELGKAERARAQSLELLRKELNGHPDSGQLPSMLGHLQAQATFVGILKRALGRSDSEIAKEDKRNTQGLLKLERHTIQQLRSQLAEHRASGQDQKALEDQLAFMRGELEETK